MTESNVLAIDVHELKNRRDSNPNLCIIDVREPHEWQEVHIPGALHLPKDELPSCIQDKIPELDTPLYLHCKGGVRSLQAAKRLVELGYREVYSVEGGITAWETSGYPVEKA